MGFSVEELIKKYDTEIDLNKMGNVLKNKGFYMNLEDMKKPIHETDYLGKETYTYECDIDEFQIAIEYFPQDYRTMEIIASNSPEGAGLTTWGWDYKGEQLIF